MFWNLQLEHVTWLESLKEQNLIKNYNARRKLNRQVSHWSKQALESLCAIAKKREFFSSCPTCFTAREHIESKAKVLWPRLQRLNLVFPPLFPVQAHACTFAHKELDYTYPFCGKTQQLSLCFGHMRSALMALWERRACGKTGTWLWPTLNKVKRNKYMDFSVCKSN